MNSFREEMMLFDTSITHTSGMDSFQEEKIPFVLPTTLCRWYRLLLIWRYYRYIFDFYHCHAKLDFGLSDSFLLFFWSTVFRHDLDLWILPSSRLFTDRAFCQNMTFAFRTLVPKEFAKLTFHFYSTCPWDIGHLFRQRSQQVLYSYCCAHWLIP